MLMFGPTPFSATAKHVLAGCTCGIFRKDMISLASRVNSKCFYWVLFINEQTRLKNNQILHKKGFSKRNKLQIIEIFLNVNNQIKLHVLLFVILKRNKLKTIKSIK